MTLRFKKRCQVAVFQFQMLQNFFIFYLLGIGLLSTRTLAQALVDTPPLSHHSEPKLPPLHSHGKPDRIASSPQFSAMKSAQNGAHIVPTSTHKSSSECHSLQTVPCHDLQAVVPPMVTKNYSCDELDFCDDILGFEAILSLHRQLDDDGDGDIDLSESDEFLRDELKYGTYANERHKAFHGNDKHITVDELWRNWKISAVHNWSVEQTVDWLCNIVELPQYRTKFEQNAIDGIALPRLAANLQFFNILGINNNIHRQKISLKATDVVLFGVPRDNSLMKDLILCGLLLFAIGLAVYAYLQHKHSKIHLRKMMKDMEALSSAEKQLEFLQFELNKTKQEHENAFIEKRDLERKLKQKEEILGIAVGNGSVPSGAEAAVYLKENRQPGFDEQRSAELEAQLMVAQEELIRLRASVGSKWIPPPKLQAYLQFTYEIEIKNYNAKKAAAELQMRAARDEWDKLKKKGSTIFGVFRAAHGTSIDAVDNTILNARQAMQDLTKEMQERIKRWNMIETLCGFDIIHNNPGYAHLEKLLYGLTSSASSATSPTMSISSGSSMVHSPSHIFPRNTSESTLMDNDSVMDSASMISGYSVMGNPVGNPVVNQAVWQHSVPMHMRQTPANIYTNYQSPLTSTISPSTDNSLLDDDSSGGLTMMSRSDEYTLNNNNGKSIYPRRVFSTAPQYSETHNAPLLRSKTVGVPQFAPLNAQQKMNLLYFRRGSSDGVERHFEDLPVTSFSDGSYQSQHDLAGVVPLVPTQANSNGLQFQLKSQLASEMASATGDDLLPPHSIPLRKINTELNEDNSSSSESTLSHRSSRSNKSLTTTPISDLATAENVPVAGATAPSQSAHKKRTFFANIRKRKTSSKMEKETK